MGTDVYMLILLFLIPLHFARCILDWSSWLTITGHGKRTPNFIWPNSCVSHMTFCRHLAKALYSASVLNTDTDCRLQFSNWLILHKTELYYVAFLSTASAAQSESQYICKEAISPTQVRPRFLDPCKYLGAPRQGQCVCCVVESEH